MPGLTHEQYLDEPLDTIQWMTRIHELAEQVKADKQRDAARG